MSCPLPPATDTPSMTAGWRHRVVAAHFHDYSPAALRMWAAVAIAGAAALAVALVSM